MYKLRSPISIRDLRSYFQPSHHPKKKKNKPLTHIFLHPSCLQQNSQRIYSRTRSINVTFWLDIIVRASVLTCQWQVGKTVQGSLYHCLCHCLLFTPAQKGTVHTFPLLLLKQIIKLFFMNFTDWSKYNILQKHLKGPQEKPELQHCWKEDNKEAWCVGYLNYSVYTGQSVKPSFESVKNNTYHLSYSYTMWSS